MVTMNTMGGEKMDMTPGGRLPGAGKEAHSGIPRWILFSMIPVAGFLLVDILPNMLKSLYAQQTETLVFTYVVIVFGFLGAALLLVLAGVVWDAMALRDVTLFGWRPGETYFSGTGKKRRKEQDGKKDDAAK